HADREHAFYIFAVDDKGKADPTPAKFFFIAFDRFRPVPHFDVSQAAGRIVHVVGHQILSDSLPAVIGAGSLGPGRSLTGAIRDRATQQREVKSPVSRDTIPSGSRIDFRWHAQSLIGERASRYRYGPGGTWTDVDSSTTALSLNTGIAGDIVNPGYHEF